MKNIWAIFRRRCKTDPKECHRHDRHCRNHRCSLLFMPGLILRRAGIHMKIQGDLKVAVASSG